MDFPTLVYLLALIGYSLFTWWKKGKAGKNAQKPATGETKEPEVPEWMKEIFGDAFENNEPAPAPKPVAEQAPAPTSVRRRAEPESQKPQLDTSRGNLPPQRSQQAVATAASMPSDERSLENMYLMEQKKRASLAKKPVLQASDEISAYEIGAETDRFIDPAEEDWRRAIILSEVIKPYDQQQR